MTSQQSFSPADVINALSGKVVNVYSPVPLRMHPVGSETINQAMVEWVEKYELHDGLYSSDYLRAMDFGFLLGTGSPTWTEEAIMAYTSYFAGFFVMDDHLDSLSGQRDALVVRVGDITDPWINPSQAPAADNNWARMSRDCRDLLDRTVAPLSNHDMHVAVCHMMLKWAFMYSVSALGRTMPVSDYLRMRPIKSGVFSLAAYLPVGCGYQLPQGAFNSPLVDAFTRSVFLPALIANDMMSLAKEMNAEHPNIVTSLAHEHHLSLTEAIKEAWVLHERIVCLMLRLQKRLLRHPSPEITRYAANLPYWISSTLHYSAASVRYIAAKDLPAPMAPPTVNLVDSPVFWDPDDLTPPPYPDIAWWWDQLGT
ncbi:hypothetical protein J7I98_36920 [Streptomyces sp. ISL-98]|uniref:terpene synthase family protein n=1 Tax=Streptomyces sp. ISL-98 TaxID=2819192 RepID=UPI001BEB94D8|nr:hypothetical protein [Streptomyces sp. ISL-98]MBT2511307.1 hypothetical protein [Streptomyces sp. ISL-98]